MVSRKVLEPSTYLNPILSHLVGMLILNTTKNNQKQNGKTATNMGKPSCSEGCANILSAHSPPCENEEFLCDIKWLESKPECKWETGQMRTSLLRVAFSTFTTSTPTTSWLLRRDSLPSDGEESSLCLGYLQDEGSTLTSLNMDVNHKP